MNKMESISINTRVKISLNIKLVIIILSMFMISTKHLHAQVGSLKGLDDYIENAMIEWQVPGLAIVIVKDDPVIKYIPDFQLYDPVVTRKITIRDLLCHRSGLGTWAGDFVWWGSTYTREYMMKRLRFIKPVVDFRSAYKYCNLMFMVAGQIIPEVTGISWYDFLKERIFVPLRMTSTNTSVKDLDLTKNVAFPHTIRDDKVIQVPYVNVDISAPAGAINSCTTDMANWLRLQLANGSFEGKQIISQEIIAETRKSHIMIPVSQK